MKKRKEIANCLYFFLNDKKKQWFKKKKIADISIPRIPIPLELANVSNRDTPHPLDGPFHKLRKHIFGSYWPRTHPNVNNLYTLSKQK